MNPSYSQPKKVELSPDKSPLIFVLTLEPFLKNIRSIPDIQRPTVADREYKVAVFADYFMLFLQRPQISLPNLLQDLEQFGNMSNLKMSYSKSHTLNISLLPDTVTRCKVNFPFLWQLESITFLGI